MNLNCISRLLLATIFSLLLTETSSLLTMSYNYDNTANSLFKTCTFPLGSVPRQTSLKIVVTLWNSLTNNFKIDVINAADNTVLSSNTCSAVSVCETIYYTGAASLQYNFRVYPLTQSQTQAYPFYVEASSFYGNLTYFGDPSSKVLIRTGDILRLNFIGRYVYFQTAANLLVSAYPIQDAVTGPSLFYLIPIAADYSYDLTAALFFTEVSRLNLKVTVRTAVTPGFYFLLSPIGLASDPMIYLTWQTDPYVCPYDPAFYDINRIAQGCTHAQSKQGYPCISFNLISQMCTECLWGYVLNSTTGTCIANTSCPDRQYYHFGQCYNVSTDCGTFDVYTGDCHTCADPANYDLVNGSCVRKSVTCGERQWQLNYTCFDVSEKCATFESSTGKCLTCKDPLFEVAADGSCVPIVVNCPLGQYAVGLSCVTIPAECNNFDTVRGLCLSCARGYYSENGVCRRVECPPGQVPSRFGLFCINVSPNCATYDAITGDCLSCKEPNHRVNPDGRCVQFNSPLAGCTERQRLGFGRCTNPEKDCKAYNLITGNCDECEEGFYLDYSGHCAKAPVCGASQWSVGGECIGVPENCLSINELGLCTRCANANYRLQLGQCVFFKRCERGQYQNSLGECVDVDPACGLFNPSNGQCVTCRDAGVEPSLGVCCPAGQVYNRVGCVDAVTLQNSYQDATGSACLLFHPSLGNCLKCAQGFTPDLTLGCVQE